MAASRSANCSVRMAIVITGLYNPRLAHTPLSSFGPNVIEPLGAHAESAVFVLLKAMSRTGAPLRAKQHRQVLSEVGALGASVRVRSIWTVDPTTERFQNLSVARCIWECAASAPRPDAARAQRRLRSQGCESLDRKARRWWGMMAIAWEAVEAHERQTRRAFDAVLFARPDLHFHRPLASPCDYNLQPAAQALPPGARAPPPVWRFATQVPDGLWLLSRDVAASALRTLDTVGTAPCSAPPAPPLAQGERHAPRCCAHGESLFPWGFSWWPLCYWGRALWGRGLRPRALDVHASWRSRGKLAPRDVSCAHTEARRRHVQSQRPDGSCERCQLQLWARHSCSGAPMAEQPLAGRAAEPMAADACASK